ncbi:MAG: excinuclease ABC subunit UvrA, partial [Clostridia bacterium]
IRENMSRRLVDSLETAMRLGGGLVVVNVLDGSDMLFSQNYACPDCGVSIEELTPRMFSFNSPYGACPTCSGLGTLLKVDPDMVLPDPTLSLNQGAIKVTGWNSAEEGGQMARMYMEALAQLDGFSLDTPVGELPEEAVNHLLYGTGKQKLSVHYERAHGSGTFNAPFEGIVTNLERRYRETGSDGMKEVLEGYMTSTPCPVCKGQRLKPEALCVTVGGCSIAQVSSLSVRKCRDFFEALTLSEKQRMIASQILKELSSRLGFLVDVGLGYLTLARAAATLSGGEAQRIRLATQIGSSLVGVLYILDEPSIGLHQKDNRKLLTTLKHLRDLGNTLIVVEHDEETMLDADMVVDIGPGAGAAGGYVVAQGTAEELMRNPHSVTGQYLSGARF